ncbi:MAG: transketolase [Leptospiraceae bacterium]|nr:transketolase [Leptospiraceae bacterium]MDW7976591.1 transketolase [Leptospiraceae bacterium]
MIATIEHSLLANAIRFLSIDAIEKAKSGHPGAPMGMADVAVVLWNEFLKHNPNNPNWWNRDRFILSNGHASMLLYSLLHLSGYDISIEELKNFRQLHSKTPGHPEYRHTPGVETTTGPLGQGFANAVGIALAEKLLAKQFNRRNFPIIDHYTFVFVGDGCLMEGISHEAASLAGKWQLNKLIVFYDSNGISIDGEVHHWFIDDTKKRFLSYNWNVIGTIDGHNRDEIRNAINKAIKQKSKPTLIICKTTIGFGSPNKAGKEVVHGAPLGSDEVQLTRENLNWKYEPFFIPKEIYDAFDAREKGQKWENEWKELFFRYKEKFPELAEELERRMNFELPKDFDEIEKELMKLNFPTKEATRKTSHVILNLIKPKMPELIGGSADLTHSNLTLWKNGKDIISTQFTGDYIHYGVREFGMFAIMNGIFLHGGFRPFGGTFLVFSDYGRNALRLSAMMELGIIYIFTHDSIGLGEDGPTHQPIEHISSLRLIPNTYVWRPFNYFETYVAWEFALKSIRSPTILVLSRQNIEMDHSMNDLDKIRKGGYVLKEENPYDVTLIATGSEVALSLLVADVLKQKNVKARVVSIPCLELFKKADKEYQNQVLGKKEKRFVIEAGVPNLWYELADIDKVFGIEKFGLSAPEQDLWKEFGFTKEKISEWILSKV